MPSQKTQPKATDIVAQVAERIRTSDNVLVALSKDPSVDELSAALGLTFMLDKIGKRATAIFSGAIPNAIEFLEPEKTFEANTDSLQDFIIALDKEKADHLRYKIDGDYVKVFITPYKTTINESDMEFSHGDYNVDLVISLNVSEVGDLDAALSEYGRIMHDATSINITAGVAGNFGDIEWGDPEASSVSEMVGSLADAIKDKDDILDKSISTALLAGIVAATNRFSNERTTAETMALASKLMAAGADQQLISSSIPVEILTEDVVDANADFAEPAPAPAPVAVAVAPEDAKIDIENPAQDLPATPVAEPIAKSAPAEPEPEPTPAPAPEPPQDPTELSIRHGEVEFDPDEDLSSEERAKKDAERAAEEAERAIREEEERKRRAPIEAAMAEITAKKSGGANAAKSAAPAPASQAAPAPQTPVSTLDAKNAAASVTASATEKSPLISTVKGNGEALENTTAGTSVSPDASAEPKKTIMPVGDVLNRKDEKVNYASLMEAELNAPAAPMPTTPAPAPVATPVEMPIEAPAMTAPTIPAPLDNVESAVYVDPTTVTADAGAVLPPPPAPFIPDAGAYMPPADGTAMPTIQPVQFDPAPKATTDLSAAQIVDGMQATNPAVENTPLMNAGEGGYLVDSSAAPATSDEPEMPAANPGYIVGAEPASAPAATPAPDAATDPSAFHIPGM